MKYQDTFINGETIEQGVRNCNDRYMAIANYIRQENIKSGFSVLDIGSNMAYFPLRLINDFGAKAMAFEFHDYDKRAAIISKNTGGGIMYLKKKITLDDITTMKSFCMFDIVLALSVLHHINEDISAVISGIRSMSKYSIFEFALNDSALTQNRINYSIPHGGYLLGHFDSHLSKTIKRPMIAYKNI